MASSTSINKSAKPVNNVLPALFFMGISLLFVLLFLMQRKLYYFLLREDAVVEWLTFACLFTSSIIALLIAIHIKKQNGYLHLFFVVFFLFAFLAGLEEISWGQRLFHMESNEFFITYNDQQEMNLHNTFQGVVGIKTKHIALFVLLVYGFVLPFAAQQGWRPVKWLQSRQLIIPPIHLAFPFLIATAFMVDYPSGMEEEIGEFMHSLCFVLLMLYNYRLSKEAGFERAIPAEE